MKNFFSGVLNVIAGVLIFSGAVAMYQGRADVEYGAMAITVALLVKAAEKLASR